MFHQSRLVLILDRDLVFEVPIPVERDVWLFPGTPEQSLESPGFELGQQQSAPGSGAATAAAALAGCLLTIPLDPQQDSSSAQASKCFHGWLKNLLLDDAPVRSCCQEPIRRRWVARLLAALSAVSSCEDDPARTIEEQGSEPGCSFWLLLVSGSKFLTWLRPATNPQF